MATKSADNIEFNKNFVAKNPPNLIVKLVYNSLQVNHEIWSFSGLNVVFFKEIFMASFLNLQNPSKFAQNTC